MSNSNPHNFPLAVAVQNIVGPQLAVICRDGRAKINVHGIRLFIIAHVHIFYMTMVHHFQRFQYIINFYFCHQFSINSKNGFVILRVPSINWPCCISSEYSVWQRASSAAAIMRLSKILYPYFSKTFKASVIVSLLTVFTKQALCKLRAWLPQKSSLFLIF